MSRRPLASAPPLIGMSGAALEELLPEGSRRGFLVGLVAGAGTPALAATTTGEGGASGADLITYRPPGNEAVGRSVEQKLRERVSVMDFGAKGDGSDDTAAIQRAIAYVEANLKITSTSNLAMGPQELHFPPGTYKITATLRVIGRIEFVGEANSEYSSGSRVVQAFAGDLFRFEAAAGGLTFGMRGMTLINTFRAGPAAGHLVHVLHGSPGYNSYRFRDCCFANPQAFALYLSGDDVRIEGCTFDVSTYSGNCICLGAPNEPVSNVRIVHNDFFDVSSHCVLLVNVRGLIVANCQVSQPDTKTKTVAFIDGIDGRPVLIQGVTIAGNNVNGARRIFGGSNASQVTITGNVCHNGGIGPSEVYDAITLNGACADVSICGNIISGAYGAKSAYSSDGAPHTGIVLVGNVLVNTQPSGTAIAAGPMSGVVDDNFIAGFATRVTANDVLALDYRIPPFKAVAFGPRVVIDASLGTTQWIEATSQGPFTIANPASPSEGQSMTVSIRNATGGAVGPVTWGPAFHMAPFAPPGPGSTSSVTFVYIARPGHWSEVSRSSPNVPA